MLIARFQMLSDTNLPTSPCEGDGPLWGLVEGEPILTLKSPPFEGIEPGKERFPLSEVSLLAPVCPSKVVAIGWNYEGHIRELGNPFPLEPLIFLKAPSAMVGHNASILLPPESEHVDFEGELAIVIGRKCRRISRHRAHEVIFGYTALNDVTARDLQRKDGQFSRAKSFDTFCPAGPWIQTELNPTAVQVTTHVNGELRQDDNTSTMLFDPYYIVEYVSAAMTLNAGDIIATGTPSGVGPLSPGDEVTVTVQGVGALTNAVIREVV
jgi:2-keto-4-pentenoate hydratase/2-oxohepta-3-ene-1,7-dioic acid hydratase in catechol pathway